MFQGPKEHKYVKYACSIEKMAVLHFFQVNSSLKYSILFVCKTKDLRFKSIRFPMMKCFNKICFLQQLKTVFSRRKPWICLKKND